MALMITALLGMAGLAIDVANWYFQAQRQQKAADAAALAGAVFLPQDVTQSYSTADTLAWRNGYQTGVASTTVTAQQESKPTRLRVTITRNVNNFFGGLLGVGTTTIRRTAVGEFAGPVPMGSPSNVFGNEPAPDGTWSSVTGNSSFWVNVAGAQTTKISGDQHQAGACASGVDGCSGSTNLDYFSLSGALDPQYQGYFYNVRVNNPPAGQKLAIEVFDPAFVQVGDTCTDGFLDSALHAIDPARYAKGPGSPFCTGDHKINAACNAPDVSCLPVTTFTFRAPDNTPWSLTDNPVIATGTCSTRTYQPFQGDLGPKISGDPTFASYFRKWVRVCEIPATDVQTYLTSVGGTYADFEVQLRTNASTGDQTAPDRGHNRLSIRAGAHRQREEPSPVRVSRSTPRRRWPSTPTPRARHAVLPRTGAPGRRRPGAQPTVLRHRRRERRQLRKPAVQCHGRADRAAPRRVRVVVQQLHVHATRQRRLRGDAQLQRDEQLHVQREADPGADPVAQRLHVRHRLGHGMLGEDPLHVPVDGAGQRHDDLVGQHRGRPRAAGGITRRRAGRRTPAQSPVKFGGRFSAKAVMASTRSFDWRNAAFQMPT